MLCAGSVGSVGSVGWAAAWASVTTTPLPGTVPPCRFERGDGRTSASSATVSAIGCDRSVSTRSTQVSASRLVRCSSPAVACADP